MADNIQPGVQKLLDNPSSIEGVSLIVSLKETPSDAVIGRIEETGATVEEELFYDNLAVSIDSDTDLKKLCSLTEIDSVEIEGKWEAMDEGNFRTLSLNPR